MRGQVQQVDNKLNELPAIFGGQISNLFERFKAENHKRIEAVERRQSAQFDELRELFFQPSSKHRKVGGADSREPSRDNACSVQVSRCHCFGASKPNKVDLAMVPVDCRLQRSN